MDTRPPSGPPPLPDPNAPDLADVIRNQEDAAALSEEEFWALMAEGPEHPGWDA